MHIIVGGCGRLGSEIAERLSAVPDNDVVVLDVDELAFDRLGAAFNGETLVGDVTDRDVLERAGVQQADGLLTVTRFDNVNLMAAQIGTELYGVPTAVARLFNPEREPVYRKLGVRHVSGTGILAKLFLNQLREAALPHHLHFEGGDVDVVDLHVGPEGHGMRLADFEQRGHVRVAALQRGSRVVIPGPDDRIERGDVLAAAVRRGEEERVRPLVRATERVRGGEG